MLYLPNRGVGMKCPHCNQENDIGASFCKHCLTKIAPNLAIPSSKSAKVYKNHTLKMLSESLKVFIPEHNEHFLCPTCLDVLPLGRKTEITEAHIIPKAVKGKRRTFLCDKCNHSFGSKQDKWLVEYLKAVKTGIPRYIIPTDIKEGAYWIDDIKINGAWHEDKDGSLAFYIYTDRNSPILNKMIIEKFKNRPLNPTFRVPVPILKNRRMIEIGFLTAGYLMWFDALGYSWVLQDHLDPIREQIRNPENDILKSKFLVYCEGARWPEPWIGMITIENQVFLTMGFDNGLVLLPPADRPNVYKEINLDRNEQIGSDIRRFIFPRVPFYGPSVRVMFENRILVFPNASHKASLSRTILFTRDSPHSQELYPISKEQSEELKKKGGTVTFVPDYSPIISDWTFSERAEKIKRKK